MVSKYEDQENEVNQAEEVEDHGSPKPATFEGHLQLKDFMFESTDPVNQGPRRSTRLSGVASLKSHITDASAADTPSTSGISTPKRKRPASKSSPSKKKRSQSSGYAPPSTYAHLPELKDVITENLLVLFIGLNPGIQTARSGHAYAHPSNLFWKLLYSSGITTRLCSPTEDRQMPELFSLGNTNIVARPSRNGSELSKQELDDGVDILQEKARKFRPESVCIVGKSIWESIWRVRHGKPVGKAFKYGWQDESENFGVIEGEWTGAKVFVASSTSGLAATLSPTQKQEIWNELGSWVKMRRAEREAEDEKSVQ